MKVIFNSIAETMILHEALNHAQQRWQERVDLSYGIGHSSQWPDIECEAGEQENQQAGQNVLAAIVRMLEDLDHATLAERVTVPPGALDGQTMTVLALQRWHTLKRNQAKSPEEAATYGKHFRAMRDAYQTYQVDTMQALEQTTIQPTGWTGSKEVLL